MELFEFDGASSAFGPLTLALSPVPPKTAVPRGEGTRVSLANRSDDSPKNVTSRVPAFDFTPAGMMLSKT